MYEAMHTLGLLPPEPVFYPSGESVTMEECSRLLKQLKTAEEQALPGILLDMQKLLWRICRIESRGTQQKAAEEKKALLEAAALRLEQDLDQQLNLELLAASCHLSYENFRKLFRKYKGVSPGRYRLEKRMQQARLLLYSGVSIKETARMTGYEDVYSFAKQFRNSFGMPPGAYVKGGMVS